MRFNSKVFQPQSSTARTALVALVACLTGAVVVGPGMLSALTEQSQPSSFVAIDPYRTIDTRTPEWGGKLPSGTLQVVSLMFNVADPGVPVVLPTGTVAVSYNVTVTETEGAGFLTIDSLPLTETATSSINWSEPGQTIANSGITRVGIGDDQTLVLGILVGGSSSARAHVVIDITGFFVDV